jgi:adenylate cyclase
LGESGFKQRLVAILSADAAAYSRLMADDERATVNALDLARAVFSQCIESNQGRVVDMAGDSVLAVFETAIGAVTAALAAQHELDRLCAELPEHRRLRYRIGIHLGDVIEKSDGTVYGDGVNISARLQAMAQVGGIVVSDAVKGAVHGKVDASLVDLGAHEVKHIPYPVHAHELRDGAGAAFVPSAAPSVQPTHSAAPTLAVLPFANMSGDPEQDYFADGMVEEITTALARMRWLFVTARNSSLTYKGRAVDVKQVGRELDVRYVLEGSVRKAGNRLRITGQLIEAESGHHVWAERFDGTLEDVFDLQDRIAEAIVSAVEPNVRRAEIERVRAKPTSDLQAYDLVMRALPGTMPGGSKPDRDEALEFIRLALERDPRYALAKALGAFLCMERLFLDGGSRNDLKLGLRYAEEALAHGTDDPTVLAYAGMTLGSLGYRKLGIRVLGFRYDEAERAIERALTQCPNLLVVQFCAAQVRMILGDADKALEHLQRALRISPRDPGTGGFIASAGAAHLVAGRYEEALSAARRSLLDAPNLVFSHALAVLALGHLGRIDEAKRAAARLLALNPNFTISRYESLTPVKDAEYRKRNAEIFRLIGVPR